MICMRIAGDEFGLYLHGFSSVSQNQIQPIWETLRDHLKSRAEEPDWNLPPFQCCAGMAVYGQDTKNIFDLIDYADYAMYQDKKSCKNNYRSFIKKQYLLEKAELEQE